MQPHVCPVESVIHLQYCKDNVYDHLNKNIRCKQYMTPPQLRNKSCTFTKDFCLLLDSALAASSTPHARAACICHADLLKQAWWHDIVPIVCYCKRTWYKKQKLLCHSRAAPLHFPCWLSISSECLQMLSLHDSFPLFSESCTPLLE